MNRTFSISVIMMAAGDSRRFSDNKLLTPVGGVPMYQYTLNWVSALRPDAAVVVTQYDEIFQYAVSKNMAAVRNPDSALGVSHTIHLGLRACPKTDAYLFTVCDQPFLKLSTVESMLASWKASAKGMASLRCEGRPGNPCVFSSDYLPGLFGLTGDTGGRAVIKRSPEDVFYYDIKDLNELKDIDTREDLPPVTG